MVSRSLSCPGKVTLCLVTFAFVAVYQRSLAETRALHWDTFVDRFVEDYFVAHPDFAVRAGRHEFDGKLPDWSRAGLAKEAERLGSNRKRALEFDPAKLDKQQRFERDYLIAVIERDLFWLTSARWPFKNPMAYASALDPNVYVARAYAPLDARMRAYIDYAKAVPNAVKQIRSNLRTPLPHTYVDIGKKFFGGLAAYYQEDVPKVFAGVHDAALQTEFRAANAQAMRVLKELTQWFEAQRAQATDDFALGADLFAQMLRDTERVEVSIDRLEKIGREDVDRNLRALRQACASFSQKTIQECIAAVQTDKPKNGAVDGARQQLPELKRFVRAKGLVTIPGPEEAEVDESPPYHRWNPAYIDIPGAFDKGLPAVYYVAPPDPAWSKAEREAYIPGKATLLFISVHEVWPGHFLQSLHARRLQSKLGQLFVSYGFAEGWAHYTEELMWETGLGEGDPMIHAGQLLDALRRDVRFLSALGLHTGGMTLKESEQMFRELAYQDPGNTRQQAARGTFDPAYLNYTLGKLMIRKLREEWTASRGGRKAWRAFHDTFLSYGGPPIPLVRKAMLGPNAGPPL
ncbi:MAG: DUF885 domain-containing protein [Pseudomonadota bacterium]|nr:DUF885 domain-containing protein [Pseudomonadota bacterium]